MTCVVTSNNVNKFNMSYEQFLAQFMEIESTGKGQADTMIVRSTSTRVVSQLEVKFIVKIILNTATRTLINCIFCVIRSLNACE